jgi:hypothetical protein
MVTQNPRILKRFAHCRNLRHAMPKPSRRACSDSTFTLPRSSIPIILLHQHLPHILIIEQGHSLLADLLELLLHVVKPSLHVVPLPLDYSLAQRAPKKTLHELQGLDSHSHVFVWPECTNLYCNTLEFIAFDIHSTHLTCNFLKLSSPRLGSQKTEASEAQMLIRLGNNK